MRPILGPKAPLTSTSYFRLSVTQAGRKGDVQSHDQSPSQHRRQRLEFPSTACLHTGRAWEIHHKGQEEVKKASRVRKTCGGVRM